MVDGVPRTLADYKAWLLSKYPNRKFSLDITPQTYQILRDNEIRKENDKADE